MTDVILGCLIVSLGLIFVSVIFVGAFFYYKKKHSFAKPETKFGEQQFENFQNKVIEKLSVYNKQVEDLKTGIDNRQVDLLKEQTKANTLGEQLGKAVGSVENIKKDLLSDYQKTKEDNSGLYKELNKFNSLLVGKTTKTGKLLEINLKIILSNFFSSGEQGTFKEQHSLSNGKIVDFMIFTESENIPIDSKFNAAKYEKILDAQTKEESKQRKKEFIDQLKLIIKELSTKYISPADNTKNVLFYIPSQGIVDFIYDHWDDCGKYSDQYKVWLVSPISLIPTISLIARFALKIKRIRGMEDILKQLDRQKQQLVKLGSDWEVYWKSTESVLKKGEQFHKRVDSNIKQIDKTLNVADKNKLISLVEKD